MNLSRIISRAGALRRPSAPKQAEEHTVEIAGRLVSVTLKPNARARRFILRMEKSGNGVRVTLPTSASTMDALAFVTRQSAWITERLAANPGTIAFRSGEVLPLRGEDHTIVYSPGRRGTAWVEAATDHALPSICVAGKEEHLERRLGDWLKREARRDLEEAVGRYTRLLKVRHTRITLRDQTSRWGSCSSSGALSFSWRLILAPADVLDYVAAHEAAHLIEMNHSPAFWGHVRRVCPHTDAAKRWLKAHGTGLHRYGSG